ncbi:MAG: FkbM family methyltransferase [Deltaproteobacteria bacterium]|nr:FkbM family methyltransferase [Deltaproteobacteria bacterium]
MSPHDKVGESLFNGWPYEEPERKFVARVVKDGMVFFDVGANLGIYTLIAAKRVGLSGSVHSFEPSPVECSKLSRNIRFNRLTNVVINQVAVGDLNKEITLKMYADGWGAYNTIGHAVEVDAPFSEIAVKQVTLDTYIHDREIKRVDFIKIDVEGAEQKVFHGGGTLVWPRLRPIVMVEFSDRRTGPLGYQARELWSWLAGFNYRWFQINQSDGGLSPAEMKQQYSYDNLVGVPDEKIVDLSALIGC